MTIYRKAFKPIHPPDTLDSLPKEALLGPVDPATLPQGAQEESEEEKRIARARKELPPVDSVLNLREIEVNIKIQLLRTCAN